MGLQLVDKQFDEGSVKSSGMGSFVWNICALLCVESLRYAVKVKAVLAELLEKKGHEDRLRYASGGNETCKFAVAQCTGGELGGTVVGQLPREDLKGGELLLCETTGWVELYDVVGGRAGCWSPNVARWGSRSREQVVWEMGCVGAVGQALWCHVW